MVEIEIASETPRYFSLISARADQIIMNYWNEFLVLLKILAKNNTDNSDIYQDDEDNDGYDDPLLSYLENLSKTGFHCFIAYAHDFEKLTLEAIRILECFIPNQEFAT